MTWEIISLKNSVKMIDVLVSKIIKNDNREYDNQDRDLSESDIRIYNDIEFIINRL